MGLVVVKPPGRCFSSAIFRMQIIRELLKQMSKYRAPWSKTVKYWTYGTIIGMSVILLGLAVLGILQVRAGQASGWILIGIGVFDWLLIMGLAPLWAARGYEISEKAVLIRKPIGTEEIPFGRIAGIEIRDSRALFAGAMKVMGSAGFFGYYGTFSGGVLSSFRAASTNDGPLVVLRLTSGDPLVISPENPTDFARELSSVAGISFEDKETSYEPMVMLRVPFSRLEKILEGISIALLLCQCVLVAVFWNRLPALVPTHIGMSGPDAWGDKSTILFTLAMSLGAYLLLTALVWVIYRKQMAPAGHPRAAAMVMLVRSLLQFVKCFVLGIMSFALWQIIS